MKRALVTLALLALALFATLLPGVLAGGGEDDAANDETTITSYDADFAVAADGRLKVREDLTVLFPEASSKRGIFRFFDVADPNDEAARRVPQDVEVQLDGNSVPVQRESRNNGRYVVLRIGDPDRYVKPGEHVYRISYRIDDTLLPTDSGASTFYWNLIPGGWNQVIEQAQLKVHLPADSSAVKCAVGVGSTSGCEVSGAGGRTLEVTARNLAPRTPVTLSTQVATSAPASAHPVPWSQRWDFWLGQSPLALVGVGVVSLFTLVGGWLAGSKALERDPQFPLMYAPPQGLGPSQTAYIATERIGDKALIGNLLHAAERGSARLSPAQNDAWQIDTMASWESLDVPTRLMGRALGIDLSGSFAATPDSIEAGDRLRKMMSQGRTATKEWAQRSGLLEPAPAVTTGLVLMVGALIVAGLLTYGNPFSMSVSAMIPAAFVAGAWPLARPGATTRRTALGRQVWSQAGGFRRILSTPSAQARFDFAGREYLYAAYLPYAVAFDVADAWADKFRTEMGRDPVVPGFLGGYAASNPGAYTDKMVSSFESAVNSAISSYEASQSSSSSGGGGFSGGGGGGGGGGGSW